MSNLSAGVQILIDQLAANPDDFFGELDKDDGSVYMVKRPPAKFRDVERHLQSLVGIVGVREKAVDRDQVRHPYWFLTDEEREALATAYREACRVRFDTTIIATQHAQPKAEERIYPQGAVTSAYAQNIARSMTATGRALAGTVYTGTGATQTIPNTLWGTAEGQNER